LLKRHASAISVENSRSASGSSALEQVVDSLPNIATANPALRLTRIARWDGRDETAYKHRNQIERCFGRLKHFRHFATRYDRRTFHFNGFVQLAAAMIWLR
jgi:hypothetical protein